MKNIVVTLENQIKTALDKFIETQCKKLSKNLKVSIERPKNRSYGDFSTNIAFHLSKEYAASPVEIAQTISSFIDNKSLIESSKVTAPGFINLVINKQWLKSQVNEIREASSSFGDSNIGNNSNVQVEYVSVNPTGVLHIGHARGAVIGDTISNVLSKNKFNVIDEYYLNDSGKQIEKFNESVKIRYQQLFNINAELPEDSYTGEDIIDVAKQIKNDHFDKFLSGNLNNELELIAHNIIVTKISNSLSELGIHFDNWFSEKSLFNNGQFQTCLDQFEKQNLLIDREGAKWLETTKLGQEKDNVILRSDSTPTYFSTDIAYHFDKFSIRNFDQVINVWGADHQGQIPRLNSALSALNIDTKNLKFILVQMVRFKKGEISEKLSKRLGTAIPLSDLVDEIGADACRFMFLYRSPDSQLEFDLDLATSQSSENPVYSVQYAHARTCGILQNAKNIGHNLNPSNLGKLNSSFEISLIHKMLDFHEMIRVVIKTLEPHHLAHYSTDLASDFHTFYQHCRVISDDPTEFELTNARLQLVDATRIVLKKCLDLMGISAPKKM